MRKWEVEADGIKHVIEYKVGLNKKIIVDGEMYKAKSSNLFINVIDYAITFGDTECRLVAIGNKVDLAVNGTFLGSKKPYEPINNLPTWIWVLVGLSTLGGMLISGLFGLVIGLLVSVLYIQFGLQKKTSPIIGLFVACLAIQVFLAYILTSLLRY